MSEKIKKKILELKDNNRIVPNRGKLTGKTKEK
jgi:hypothetical protein